jgi:hypothetical protein
MANQPALHLKHRLRKGAIGRSMIIKTLWSALGQSIITSTSSFNRLSLLLQCLSPDRQPVRFWIDSVLSKFGFVRGDSPSSHTSHLGWV